MHALSVNTCYLTWHTSASLATPPNPYINPQTLTGQWDLQVRADKQREVRDGHDGTWVAHPALMPIAKQIFDEGMPSPNQVPS